MHINDNMMLESQQYNLVQAFLLSSVLSSLCHCLSLRKHLYTWLC